MRNAFANALYEIGKEKENLFVVVADISPAGSMNSFRNEFPARFVNVGVAEQSMIGVCAGLALRGCVPFAYSIATFSLYRPFEQIRVDLCYQNLPVTVVGMGAGLCYGTLGGTHHAQEDIAVMSALPNMSILAPCDPLETTAATKVCAGATGPMYLRLGKAGEPILTQDAVEPFKFGQIRQIKEGERTCILSYGPIMKMAFDVAKRVEESSHRPAAIFSVHTLKPLDRRGIADVLRSFETVVVIEEHSEVGGLAAQVKQLAWDQQSRCRLETFSLKDEFIHEYGSTQHLWNAHGLSLERICSRVVTPQYHTNELFGVR